MIGAVVSGETRNALVEAAIAEDRPLIGVTCAALPAPLLSVGGMVPIRLRHLRCAGTPMADTYLSSVLCHYPRSLLEAALEGEFDHLDGFVFATSCDHLRRLYDNMSYLLEPAFTHIVDIPHTSHAEARRWFEGELRALTQRLEEQFDIEFSDEAIVEAVDDHNRSCALLREIGELRKLDVPPFTGGDFHRMVLAGQVAPRDKVYGELKEAHRNALDVVESRPRRKWRARLMVVGSQIDDPRYLDIIESVGGIVVADRFCSGSLPGTERWEVGGDPIADIAAHALERAMTCPRMMTAYDQRLEFVGELVKEYNVHGVIIEAMKFCDLWGVESAQLVRDLRARGVPALRLEREYALSGEGQLKTRVQAFLESMGR